MKRSQEKWEPVFRPETRQKGGLVSRKSGNRSSVRKRARNGAWFPGKVGTGFPSGNAPERGLGFQEKWESVFRPETRQRKGSGRRLFSASPVMTFSKLSKNCLESFLAVLETRRLPTHPDPDGRPAERDAVSRRARRLAARAEPEGAGRTLGAVFQRLHRLAALRAGAGERSCRGSCPPHRVYDNAAEFASDIPTYAHHLRRAGYQTCLSGKMHFVGPDQLHGFEERLTTDIYPADFGWTPDYRKPGERIDWWYHNLGSVTGAGVAEITNQMEYDDEVAYHATRSSTISRAGKTTGPGA
jgi:hypothetical protein